MPSGQVEASNLASDTARTKGITVVHYKSGQDVNE